MKTQSSATAEAAIAVSTPGTTPRTTDPAPQQSGFGTLQAALGVVAFSLTFPATAWGLEGFGPWTLVAVRSVLAALIAGGCLLALRVAPPERRHWAGLAVVAAGVVVGFPLLTTLALRTSTTSHAAVVVGLLPLTTALLSALRMGTRPSRTFWAAALAGAGAVVAFTVRQSGGAVTTADLYLSGALLVCAAGYTEGGRLARVMPGWQVIGWALVFCLPLSVPAAALALTHEPLRPTAHSVAGLLWVAAGSQFLGLVVWYRGMAAIGIPKASQLQLAQPLLTLVWSVLLLGEQLTPAAPLTAAAVLICIAVTQRARGRSRTERTAAPAHGEEATQMRATKGDQLVQHGRVVGQHDKVGEIVEVLGQGGNPPYRVRFEDGHVGVCSPGPDTEIRHRTAEERRR